jgi:uncharacterized LabA/DUF88 family protein
MNRVCVFIDGSSFYFGLKRNNRITRVDYHEFSKGIIGPDRNLIRTYYYNSTYDPVSSPEQRKGQQPFLDSLTRMPYVELRMGRIIPLRDGGFREKGTDVLLASDIIFYAARNFYDTAIVITEDPDFAPVLNQLKELGPHVELGLFRDSQPRELVSAADRVIPLEDVLDKFSSKIFPEIPEENFGNRLEVSPLKKRTVFKAVAKNS